MANYLKWEQRFPVLKKDKKTYWVIPVRKKLGSRIAVFDPSQINLFDTSVVK